jgi:hypothetical protein
MWGERVDKKFRDRAPHTEHNLKGTEGEFFVCENIDPVQVAGFFGSGKTAEELPEHRKRGFEAAPKSVWDPAERLKEQDRDGVNAEAMYTSMGMLLFGLDDAELRAACFRGFNDWAAEYTSYDPKRLIGLGTVELGDITAAVAEIERCRKIGIRGVLIWGSPPDDKPYSHRDYDPFWAAAQDLDMPISLHILTGRRGTGVDPQACPALVHVAAAFDPGVIRGTGARRRARALPASQAGLRRKRHLVDAALLLPARSCVRPPAAPRYGATAAQAE